MIKKTQTKYIFMSLASLFFYGYWSVEYIYLIVLSGAIDFLAGLLIYHNQNFKKLFLGLSLILNVGILFAFKYFSFVAHTLNELFIRLDLDIFLNIEMSNHLSILPIGISFFTFQSMSYTIDIYRDEMKPTKNFFKYFTYISMFPQLVAGPIVRAKDIMNQLNNIKLQKGDELYLSLRLIVYGYLKKTVIADGVAKYVNTAFENPLHSNSSLYWWSVATSFGIQIYCDFSGYSDIATGLARLLGVKFPLNFNHPYRAIGFQDFWNRWHISLSSWFRDYLYIPLGGNKHGVLRSHLNLWITMIVSGLWHGANFTFLIWGGLHALFLSAERCLRKTHINVPTIVKRIIVIKLLILSWVYFRSSNLSQANNIVMTMLSYSGLKITVDYRVFTIVVLFILKECFIDFEYHLKHSIFDPVWVGVLAALSIFLRGEGNEFIYFQF